MRVCAPSNSERTIDAQYMKVVSHIAEAELEQAKHEPDRHRSRLAYPFIELYRT